jgi:hypothetical protein
MDTRTSTEQLNAASDRYLLEGMVILGFFIVLLVVVGAGVLSFLSLPVFLTGMSLILATWAAVHVIHFRSHKREMDQLAAA